MFSPHHDDLPTDLNTTQNLKRDKFQRDFLGALSSAGELLNALGTKHTDYMVISGGGVFLHQLAMNGSSERSPTDLDIVIRNQTDSRELCDDLVKMGSLYFKDIRLITEPRHHHGLTFTNPIVEAETHAGFPVDFIPESMIT
jgi:hypothetical protein